MSRPRSRVQKPHGNAGGGGGKEGEDGPLEGGRGPPRGYKLHCSLVLAAMRSRYLMVFFLSSVPSKRVQGNQGVLLLYHPLC